jgi:hypothetical protein
VIVYSKRSGRIATVLDNMRIGTIIASERTRRSRSETSVSIDSMVQHKIVRPRHVKPPSFAKHLTCNIENDV